MIIPLPSQWSSRPNTRTHGSYFSDRLDAEEKGLELPSGIAVSGRNARCIDEGSPLCLMHHGASMISPRRWITGGWARKISRVGFIGLLKRSSSCPKNCINTCAFAVDYSPFDPDEKDINADPSVISIWEVRAYARLALRRAAVPWKRH
jgi:hypothetical protein